MAASATILIVDDTEAARDTLDALLFAQDRELVFAEDGPNALAKIADVRPDLVLLDVMMPEMDGYEVCERIRHMPEVQDVPIIMVTALDDRESRLKGLSAGADDFVSKPFDSVELRTRVNTVLRLDRYRKLLAEKERLLWVLNSSEDGYAIIDSGDRILYANAKARDLLQLGEDATETGFVAAAQGRFDLKPPAAWGAWPTPPDDNGVTRYLIRPESSSAPALWVRVDIQAAEGEAERHIVRLRDVTRDTEDQLHTWSFQEAVSHKLNTPITALMGGVELLSESLADLPDEGGPAAGILQMVEQCADRLGGAVRDVLTFAGDDADPDEAQPLTVTDIRTLVEETASHLGLQNVTVSVSGAADSRTVPLSPRAMSAILLELLDNARKFHPQQTPGIKVQVTEAPGALTIAVIDDGVSLPGEVLDQVWQPYFQFQKQWTGEVAGMGLGLSHVARMVWRVGGSADLQNRPDRPGTIVRLTFPA